MGSPVITFDAPNLARSWAVQRLRALGWEHVVPEGLGASGRALADAGWTGETYCFDCAGNLRMRRRA